MRIDSASGLRGKWFDESGARVPFVIWYETETFDFEALVAVADGSRPVRPNIRYKGKKKLRFVQNDLLTAVARVVPKPECPPVEVQGVQVGADCNAECEAKGCHRRATWLTGDEQLVEPATGEDGKRYERGVIVRGHYYCSKHFRLPVSTSLRGVESEIQVTARPQW